MKKRPVDLQRTVIAHNEPAKVAQPSERALHRPAPFVAPEDAAILRRRAMAVRAMRCDQQDAPPPQPSAQRVAVIALVGDHPQRLLTRTARAMSPAYTDRRERRFRKPDFRRGRRTKVVPQRNSAAVDHHHPLRPLAPLGFSDFRAPFLAGAKLPSRNDSLHCNCRRSFNSLKNARQMFSQTPCSSQSRSRRQHVEGCGYFSGISCQRAPLRRIQRIPSNTRRFSIHGRPPLRCLRGLGSKGAIFFHCASVSNGPARAIGPPSALLTLLIQHFGKSNHHLFKRLYQVMQQLLVSADIFLVIAARLAAGQSPPLGVSLQPPGANLEFRARLSILLQVRFARLPEYPHNSIWCSRARRPPSTVQHCEAKCHL